MTLNSADVPDAAGFAASWLGQRVVFADGALARLPDEVGLLGAQRVMLIASERDGLGQRAGQLLGGLLAGQWSEVRQHVPADVAARLAAQARQVRADALVSIGGGSATGLAKITAIETGLPVLAVPTTYAGSEMTPVWGRTQDGVKRTGRDSRALPRTVLYDPELLAGLPPAMAGPSAMNALAHCVEALYAPSADPLTSMTALAGAELIARVLPAAAARAAQGNAADQDSRRGLLWASCLAGRSFGTAGGSLHHSLCHLLGGSADLPHAQTHAVVLPHVVAFLAPVLDREFARLAAALDVDSADLAGAIWDLGAKAGTPAGLRELGLAEASLPALARELAARSPASPRPLDDQGALGLLTAAWTGERPVPPARSQAAPMTVRDLTQTVLDRLQATADPRLRELMTALVRHLHGMVAEVNLSQDEWFKAIGFLTATGQICSDRRQEFILLSDTLGVSMLVDLLAGPGTEGAAGHATESTVLGPFYVADSPERPYGGSIIEQPAGEFAWYTGRVLDTDGRPIAGAELDVWQNADDMLYAVQNPDAPPGHLRGLFRTRPDGSYAFLGVRPTDYPIPADGPVGALLAATGRHPWRPAHIHLIVRAPGYRSVATHIFDAESRYIGSDAVFAVKQSLLQDFERHEPGEQAPDGVPPGAAWYSVSYDFLLEPE